MTVTVNECLGIDNNTLFDNFDFLIYPNPSNGSITLSGNKDCYWRIMNELGEELIDVVFETKASKLIQVKLSAGIYLVQAYHNHSSIVKKIIVSKTD